MLFGETNGACWPIIHRKASEMKVYDGYHDKKEPWWPFWVPKKLLTFHSHNTEKGQILWLFATFSLLWILESMKISSTHRKAKQFLIFSLHTPLFLLSIQSTCNINMGNYHKGLIVKQTLSDIYSHECDWMSQGLKTEGLSWAIQEDCGPVLLGTI